jgi:hypothetical protein
MGRLTSRATCCFEDMGLVSSVRLIMLNSLLKDLDPDVSAQRDQCLRDVLVKVLVAGSVILKG